ncbi:Gag protein, partial [Phytophthora palmivora]
MDREEFPHLTDAQFESVRKMVGIFGGNALRSLAAASPAEQVERIEAFDTLKVNPYEGKEGENLHFWVREVELAMDAALISAERLRVAFAMSNLGGRVKTWAYTREATTPGCFTTWAQLCQQLRAAFLPANYEYRQLSRFLAYKQGKRELHEYIQEMRVLATYAVGNPLPEHIKVTVFMDGLKVSPSRTQLVRVHVNTMEEAIQIALQQEDSHRQARTLTSVWQGHNASSGAVQGAPAAGASTGPVPMELETRKSSGGLLVVHASVRGYEDPFRVLIDSGASTNFARRQTVARNGDKYTDALRESEGREQVSVRLADGTVVNVPGVRMDLAVKFEVFESTELFLVLDMDKYDLILGMPWLEKQGPWIDWLGKTIEASRPAVSDRALVSNVPPLSGTGAPEMVAKALTRPKKYLNSSSVMDEGGLEGFTKQRATRLGSEILKKPADPVYPLVKEFSEVVSKHPPSQLPPYRGVWHEIDLVPGTKYCVTKQWPLPREQCEVIDAFFADKAKSGMVRESTSPHSPPTFCVRKPNEKWRLVHAHNKLNNATVPAQTLIPRKDVLLNNMSGCTLYSAQGMVRESTSPHSPPTFCVRKPNEKWRLVHAHNKLNNATVPAQTL